LRVVLDARLLAMTHACTGPLYFAVCVAIWFYTSRSSVSPSSVDSPNPKAFRLALLTTCLAYFQLVLGAVVRHMPVYAPPRTFHAAVMFHLFMAAVLTVHVVLLARAAFRTGELRRGAAFLSSLIVMQLSLGAGTWIVNFGYPQWVGGVVNTPDFVVRTNSLPQLMVTTAHVAVGSLILVTSLVLTLRARRFAASVATAAWFPAGLALREALR
jgi:cytochrome c oxidase assembly protein subunit 15